MNSGSASSGEIELTPEELQRVARIRESAAEHPVREGTRPSELHRAVLGGIDVAFYLWIDAEDESAQYRLELMSPKGQPTLRQVQGFARRFFDTLDFQIMPDPFNAYRVQVTGLFFPPDMSKSS